MPTSTSYDWPVMSTQAVCLNQDIIGSGDLLLNGVLGSALTPNQISFTRAGFVRNVSITSVNDLSAATFTITGLQNNAIVEETIVGPNNGTVFSTKFYDVIGTVSVDQAVTAVEVGTGDTGFFPLINPNPESRGVSRISVLNYALATILSPGSGLTYTLYSTLEDTADNGVAYEDELSVFFPITPGATTNQLYQSSLLVNKFLLKITGSTIPVTDQLSLTILQQ